MGCRVTAFSRTTDPKVIEEIKSFGAVEVIKSDDPKAVAACDLKFHVVVTCVPHVSKEMDELY